MPLLASCVVFHSIHLWTKAFLTLFNESFQSFWIAVILVLPCAYCVFNFVSTWTLIWTTRKCNNKCSAEIRKCTTISLFCQANQNKQIKTTITKTLNDKSSKGNWGSCKNISVGIESERSKTVVILRYTASLPNKIKQNKIKNKNLTVNNKHHQPKIKHVH